MAQSPALAISSASELGWICTPWESAKGPSCVSSAASGYPRVVTFLCPFCSLHAPHVATAGTPCRAQSQGWLSTELLCPPLVTIPVRSGSPASNPTVLLLSTQGAA